MQTTQIQNHLSGELETADRAAREAGAIIMSYFGSNYRIEEKGHNNPVTTADLAANRKIREVILGRFPDDGWLSEEDKDSPARLSSSRVWVVDPIDGTKEFIEGVPQFAVSIGLVVDGLPKIGVVFNPATKEFYRAVQGGGANLNDRPIHVSSRSEIDGSRILVSRSESRRKFEGIARVCRLDPVGSIAFRLAKVAAGTADGTLTFRALHEWDFCAGLMIVEEAGGRVTDGRGERIIFNGPETRHRGLVASNPVLGRALQPMLAENLFRTP